MSKIGIINSIQTLGSVDGPGVRFVVFMQGCKMRCKYCHNPETWQFEGEEITASELTKKALKYKAYWGENGGVTVSGGEPLLQIDFLIEFFKLLKLKGVHTAIDTAAQPFVMDESFLEKFNELLKYTDLFLLDIKHIDSQKHKKLTSVKNENILEMAKYLSDNKKPVWIRYVLVPGLTDDMDDIKSLSKFIKTLDTVEKIEVLPYHTYGITKWKKLGLKYPLNEIQQPTDESVKIAESILDAAINKL